MLYESLVALGAGGVALGGGGSGILAVPDAGLIEPDTAEYARTNGRLSVGENTSFLYRRSLTTERAATDHLTLAVIPRLELGFRLTTWYDEQGKRSLNDLSGHAKLQLLDVGRHQFAVGARDFAGDAVNFSPVYFGVGSVQFGRFKATAGYGVGKDKNVALSGAFGGFRYSPTTWFDLLADYDGLEAQAGFRLSGHIERVSVYAQTYVSTNDADPVYYQVGIRVPLGGKGRLVPKRSSTDQGRVPMAPALSEVPTQRVELLREPVGADGVAESLSSGYLMQEQGLCGGQESVHASGVPVLELGCDQGGQYDVRWKTSWSGLADWSVEDWGHLNLRVEPALSYAVGTEVGRLDYDARARFSGTLVGPIGLSAYVVYDEPLVRSDDYEEGGFFNGRPIGPRTVQKGWQYTVHALPGVFAQWTQGMSGDLRFKRWEVLAAPFGGRMFLDYHRNYFTNAPSRFTKEYEIGRFFTWLTPGGYAALISAGTFLYGDEGYRVDMYKFFGRTRLGVYYKEADAFNDIGVDKAMGLTFMMQLSPDKSLGNRWVSVSGNPHFGLGVETSIDTGDLGNELQPFLANQFTPLRNLVTDTLDRWRYTPYYIQSR